MMLTTCWNHLCSDQTRWLVSSFPKTSKKILININNGAMSYVIMYKSVQCMLTKPEQLTFPSLCHHFMPRVFQLPSMYCRIQNSFLPPVLVRVMKSAHSLASFLSLSPIIDCPTLKSTYITLDMLAGHVFTHVQN